jgi:hypothetical protein
MTNRSGEHYPQRTRIGDQAVTCHGVPTTLNVAEQGPGLPNLGSRRMVSTLVSSRRALAATCAAGVPAVSPNSSGPPTWPPSAPPSS